MKRGRIMWTYSDTLETIDDAQQNQRGRKVAFSTFMDLAIPVHVYTDSELRDELKAAWGAGMYEANHLNGETFEAWYDRKGKE